MGVKSGIKTFDVTALTKASIIKPAEVGYQDSIDIIYDELQKTRKSFIKIGWYLKHINAAEMYREDGYTNIYEFAHDKFNISQSTATRFINLCNEFSVGHDSPELDEKYLDFSVSQLFEMLPMKQEQKDQVTPDMTVKDIREIKNEAKSVISEPADKEICSFYVKHLINISADDRKNLKEYMSIHYGKSHSGGGPNPDFECSPRGIRINSSDEITWTRFVNRVNELIPIPDGQERKDVSEEDNNDNIPGQTSIEKDFPEYMPGDIYVKSEVVEVIETNSEGQLTNKIPDRCTTGWSKYPEHCSCCGYNGVKCCAQCEKGQNHNCNSRCGWVDEPYEPNEAVTEPVEEYATSHKMSDDEYIEIEEERKLRDEIESLADSIREVFWSWNATTKMPREEIIVAKENALKLTDAIEKLLDIIC